MRRPVAASGTAFTQTAIFMARRTLCGDAGLKERDDLAGSGIDDGRTVGGDVGDRSRVHPVEIRSRAAFRRARRNTSVRTAVHSADLSCEPEELK